ncbi:MAG: hypothetical protein AAFV98_14265 [Chloroflexota bacterium]
MVYRDSAINTIQKQAQITPLRAFASQAAVQVVFRFTVYYVDGRAYNSVATLVQQANQDALSLETTFVGFCAGRPITRHISRTDFQTFMRVIQKSNFDTMYFPEDKLLHTATIWQVERATGQFYHSVVLNPHCHDKPYCVVVNAIDSYLPDAVREMRH